MRRRFAHDSRRRSLIFMYSYFKMRKTTFREMSETHGRDISSGGSAMGEGSGVLLLIPPRDQDAMCRVQQ